MALIRILAAVVGAGYCSAAIVVGAHYWTGLSRKEIDDAVASAQLRVAPFAAIFAPVIAVLVRPLWAAVHGLLWPVVLWGNRNLPD